METLTVDDLTLDELWAFVAQGQMAEARYWEIVREREQDQTGASGHTGAAGSVVSPGRSRSACM